MGNSYYKSIVCGVFILFSGIVFGQNKLSKEIKETHPLTNNGAVYLDNKYGDVFINGWDKDSVQIHIDVEVKGKNLDKAKDLLKRIVPKIVHTNSQLIIKSEIMEKQTSFFNRYISKIGPFNSEKSNTDINYTVYLPKSAELEVVNRYGDIIISDWNGELVTEVEHGDLRVTDSIAVSKISIKYGKLRANTLHRASINAKDATVSFDNSEVLKLTSDGSTISLDTVGQLDLNSNKDDLEIGNLDNVFGKVKFSRIVLNNVTSQINLNLNLAELRVMQLEVESPVVNIHQKSSDVYINISETNFNFAAELEQGVLRIPKTLHGITSKVLDEKSKTRQIRAIYGNKDHGIFDFTGYKGVIILKEL